MHNVKRSGVSAGASLDATGEPVQADVEPRCRVRQRADADAIDPGGGNRGDGLQIDSTRRLQFDVLRRRVAELDGVAKPVEVQPGAMAVAEDGGASDP